MLDELKKQFNINETSELEFHDEYDVTFVFKRKIIHINNKITSAEIKPIGIICMENNEFYFTPLYEDVNINEIIQEFVEKY